MVIINYSTTGNLVAVTGDADYRVQSVWALPMSKEELPPKIAAAVERRLMLALVQWCGDRVMVYRNQYDHDRFRQDCRRLLDKAPSNRSVIMSLVADLVPGQGKLQETFGQSPLWPALQILETLRSAGQSVGELAAQTQVAYSKPVTATPVDIAQAHYIYDHVSNILHHKNCPQCPTEGVLYAYPSIQRTVGRFPRLCSCCRQEYQQALRYRNQKTVNKMRMKYLFCQGSNVLHDPQCSRLLLAHQICGIDDYAIALRKGYRPCKVCKPREGDAKRQAALELYHLVCADRDRLELWSNRSQQYRSVLASSKYAFISGGPQTDVHLRNCQCVYTLDRPKGYMHLAEALADGCTLCSQCEPNDTADIDEYYPIYGQADADDGPRILQLLCTKEGYGYTCRGSIHTIRTAVGEWYLNAAAIPFTLEHRNLSGIYGPPKRHVQPVLFLRWRDVYRYIHKHDRQLMQTMELKKDSNAEC